MQNPHPVPSHSIPYLTLPGLHLHLTIPTSPSPTYGYGVSYLPRLVSLTLPHLGGPLRSEPCLTSSGPLLRRLAVQKAFYRQPTNNGGVKLSALRPLHRASVEDDSRTMLGFRMPGLFALGSSTACCPKVARADNLWTIRSGRRASEWRKTHDSLCEYQNEKRQFLSARPRGLRFPCPGLPLSQAELWLETRHGRVRGTEASKTCHPPWADCHEATTNHQILRWECVSNVLEL